MAVNTSVLLSTVIPKTIRPLAPEPAPGDELVVGDACALGVVGAAFAAALVGDALSDAGDAGSVATALLRGVEVAVSSLESSPPQATMTATRRMKVSSRIDYLLGRCAR
jgi:hypothetical protein